MYRFDFENLDVYKLALEVARWARSQRWPVGQAHLRDQATRALDSMVLNIAEGMSRPGRAGLNHLRIARGSAGEGLAALQLSTLSGVEPQLQKLRRIGAMCRRLRPPA